MNRKFIQESYLGNPLAVAVIGGGIAGLSCAQELIKQGCQVHLFEKENNVSGRMATTLLSSANMLLLFDHGAQYFTARAPEFLGQIHQWEKQKVVAKWDSPFVSLNQGEYGAPFGSDTRYVGIPGMDAICNRLFMQIPDAGAGFFRLRFNKKVTALLKKTAGWRIQFTEAESDKIKTDRTKFDAVVLAMPSSQAITLLPGDSPLRKEAEQIKMAPCLAVLIAFEKKLALPFGGAFVLESPIRWISNNSSMPSRSSNPEQWVLHPSSDWSADHAGESDEQILNQILTAFQQATTADIPTPIFQQVFRWKDAIPLNPSSAGYFCDPESNLLLCGDWCNDARVEGAYMSGYHAATFFTR